MARGSELKIVEIPEHVKREAMDAVSHKETTDQIRAFQGSGMQVSAGEIAAHSERPEPQAGPIPDDVKRQAMDAVSHPETRAMIQLVKDNGEITTPLTPSIQTDRIAAKVAELHKSGNDLDSTHRTITQDHFGREDA